MKLAIAISVLCLCAFGQTTPTDPSPFPNVTLPVAVAAFGTFNQLGTPRFTGGVSAIYPYPGVQTLGLYGTTTADVKPVNSVDPATGRNFYAVSASMRQGVHKDLVDVNRWKFLLGFDLGPSFAQGQPTGIGVSLSTSFIATALYQISPVVSAIAPVRMLYISGVGWNPVVEVGVAINLTNLPKGQHP